MTIERIGHGAGRREFVEQPNLLRLFVGDGGQAPISGGIAIRSGCWKRTSTTCRPR